MIGMLKINHCYLKVEQDNLWCTGYRPYRHPNFPSGKRVNRIWRTCKDGGSSIFNKLWTATYWLRWCNLDEEIKRIYISETLPSTNCPNYFYSHEKECHRAATFLIFFLSETKGLITFLDPISFCPDKTLLLSFPRGFFFSRQYGPLGNANILVLNTPSLTVSLKLEIMLY